MSPLRGDLNAATGGDEGMVTVSLYRRAEGSSRLVVRSEFTTASRGIGYGKLSDSLCACGNVKSLAGAMNEKRIIMNMSRKLNCIE